MEKSDKLTKVCTDPDCPHKGEPQPIEHFRRARYGRLGVCITCMSRRQSVAQKLYREKKAKGTVKEKPTPPPAMPEAPAAPSNGHTITIDFNERQDLLASLKERAAGQLRTPENQVLFLVMQFCNQPPGVWA